MRAPCSLEPRSLSSRLSLSKRGAHTGSPSFIRAAQILRTVSPVTRSVLLLWLSIYNPFSTSILRVESKYAGIGNGEQSCIKRGLPASQGTYGQGGGRLSRQSALHPHR